ncbi:MAG TPA: hypothetical protein ENK93_05345, partial [Campylobacteraceae bacterium]|nr:hypothetical protein [Campylobacteraceae bacterium]
MHTYEIKESVLESYKKSRLSDERINDLIRQADEQLGEISQNEALYNSFSEEVEAPAEIDNIILWMLFMSNEDICSDYISQCKKSFMDSIPGSDLAELLLYVVHRKKVEHIDIAGFDYLLQY